MQAERPNGAVVWTIVCTILLMFTATSLAGTAGIEQDILQKIFHANSSYDWRIRPDGTNKSAHGMIGPVYVNVNMLIRSISKIDDVNMEYSTQFTFREEWVDSRLAYEGLPDFDPSLIPSFIVLPPKTEIWMPDTFFQNEKEAHRHDIDKPNVLIRIHKNGAVLYSVRLSLVLSCPMYLHNYPMDTQQCNIDLASYAYTTNDIEYLWKQSNKKPIQLKPGVESSLPSFELVDVETGYCTSVTATGTYSCLRTTLTMKRQFSYYLLQLYIPSTMLVIVSWVSFWLDRSAVPARVTLGVTTLLTMQTQASGINAKLPPVSYTKAIDMWIGTCMTFIFGALLEFAYVTYAGGKAEAAEGTQRRARNSAATASAASSFRHHRKRVASPLPCNCQPPTRFYFPSTANSTARLDDAGKNPLLLSDRASMSADFLHGQVWAQQSSLGTPPLVWFPQQQDQRLPPSTTCRHSEQTTEAPPTFYVDLSESGEPTKDSCVQWPDVFYRYGKIKDPSKRADFLSRIIFPLGFLIFNIIYWTAFKPW